MPNSIAILGAVICGSVLISSIILSEVFCRVPELSEVVPEPVPEPVSEPIVESSAEEEISDSDIDDPDMQLPPPPRRKNMQELILEVQELPLIHQVVSDFKGRLVDVHELSEE